METQEVQRTNGPLDDNAIFSVITAGDCSHLTPQQKLQYYKARCDAAGLDSRTAPFQFIKLQGREVLYALKMATDQLAKKHGIGVEICGQTTEAGVRTVTVRAADKDGRRTDEIGCVSVEGLKGDALCNAFMKAVTKAKRRAVLSLCGLGMLDETEIETIPGASLPAVRPPTWEAVTDSDSPADHEEPTAEESLVESANPDLISDKQQKRLFAVAMSAGWTTAAMKVALRDKYGYEHTKDIRKAEYDAIVSFFKNPK